ncbi:MAG: ribokinase [Nitrospiraceae bacterium]|nr:ribokinase [Nitrospiraceae bacterium]
MKMPAILVVGSANIDLVTGVPRCPKPGESLIGTTFETIPGGKGANQAVGAACLGAPTFFAGCVGADAFGDMQRQALSDAEVDVTYLKTHPSEPTGTAVIFVAEDGQNSIVVIPSANFGILPADVDGMDAAFEQADVVLLQLEIPLETVDAVLDKARAAGVLSILDAGPAQEVPEELVRKADVVSPNETEAEAMTGIRVDTLEDAQHAAQALRGMGAGAVVLKLGSKGAYYLGDEAFQVPAFKIDPVDTVAAGDAFTAALGCAWPVLPPREAIRFANAAGGLAATVAGAQPSMPSYEAVQQLMHEQGDLTGE